MLSAKWCAGCRKDFSDTLSEKKQQDVRPIVYGRTKLWLKKETAGFGGLK